MQAMVGQADVADGSGRPHCCLKFGLCLRDASDPDIRGWFGEPDWVISSNIVCGRLIRRQCIYKFFLLPCYYIIGFGCLIGIY